jgi:membrane protease YdiL (CAAX protease family)
MESTTVRSLPIHQPSRGVVVLAYLTVLIDAEMFVGVGTLPAFAWCQEIGLTVEILLLFALLFHSVFIWDRDRRLAYLLMAMSLAPLDRLLSVAIPHDGLTTVEWLAIVSAPLLVMVASVAYVEGMWIEELGLHVPRARNAWFQGAVALTAIPLGLTEYYILRPYILKQLKFGNWFPEPLTLVVAVGATLVLFFATGFSEELMFRGIMLQRAVESLDTVPGILFVTAVFGSMHIFYLNALDLVFVLCVGLLYAVVVMRSRSLWGVILSHTFANVILYVIAPVVLK